VSRRNRRCREVEGTRRPGQPLAVVVMAEEAIQALQALQVYMDSRKYHRHCIEPAAEGRRR